MNIYTINENNFHDEKIISGGLPIMLMAKIFEKTARKFKTLDKIEGKSIIIIETPISIKTSKSEKCSIYKLSSTQQLIVLDYNSVIQLSNNQTNKFFVSNEFEFVSSLDNQPQNKLIYIDNLNQQEKIAFDWLKTNGVGASAQSVVFYTFPKLQQYYEDTKGKSFSFSYPHDTADFNRCLKVINLLSLSDNQIQYLANISKEWNKIIQSFDIIKTHMDNNNYDEAYKIIKNCTTYKSKNKP